MSQRIARYLWVALSIQPCLIIDIHIGDRQLYMITSHESGVPRVRIKGGFQKWQI